MAWEIHIAENEVVPRDDMKPHVVGAECWCCPFPHDGLMVHVSMDGREAHEPDAIRRPLNA
jgi:hypothetical protein